MRPTLRAAFLVGLGIPLSLVLIVGNEDLWLFGVLYLFFVLLLVGYDSLNMVVPSRLNLQQDIPSLLHAGGDDYAYFKLTVDTTQRAFGLEALLEVDETYLKRPEPAYVPRLERSLPVDLAFPLMVKRRGSCQLSRLWLRWYSPWGLIERKTTWNLEKNVTIIPNITAVKSAALQLSSRDAFHGIKVQKQQGDGTEFDALREYVPGFDLRSVDWKHSARHRKLVCKEFQVERNHNVILAFDTGHLMCRPLDGLPQLDHMINAGLLLGYMALRGGDRVGLYGFNSRIQMFAEPLGGSRAFHHLQANCARLDYQHDETNFTLGLANLLGKLPRRSLIVIYTDFVDTVTAELMVENITRLAKRHLVLFVTLSDRELMNISQLRPGSVTDIARSVIADDFLRERRIVFERLRRLGVHCLEAPAASVSAALVERYLEIKQQELI